MPYSEEIAQLRGHSGHAQAAENVRALIAGSQLVDCRDEDTEGKLQDAYSLRCAPQIHGASRNAFEYVAATLTAEMNSVNDNPLIFVTDGSVCSAGNFHGQPIALVLDHLALAVSELGNVSERRCARLLDPRDNCGLPPFLVTNSGLNSGLMIAQYTAAALASENNDSPILRVPTLFRPQQIRKITTAWARSLLDMPDVSLTTLRTSSLSKFSVPVRRWISDVPRASGLVLVLMLPLRQCDRSCR